MSTYNINPTKTIQARDNEKLRMNCADVTACNFFAIVFMGFWIYMDSVVKIGRSFRNANSTSTIFSLSCQFAYSGVRCPSKICRIV